MRWHYAAAALITVTIAGSLISCGPDNTSERSDQHAQDVTITDCPQSLGSYVGATVNVKNNSSKESDYTIQVGFERGSQQVDTSYVFVDKLAPGQSTTKDASTLTEANYQPYTCKLLEATRHASA